MLEKLGRKKPWSCFQNAFTVRAVWEIKKQHVAAILGSIHDLSLAVVGSAAYLTETGTPPSTYRTILLENEERMKYLLLPLFCDIRPEVGTESTLATYLLCHLQPNQAVDTDSGGSSAAHGILASYECRAWGQDIFTSLTI